MATYTGSERASSTNPGDWGRALAVAFERLLRAARLDGHYAEHERLFGVDLTLRMEEDAAGATITVQWTPQDSEECTAPKELAG